MPPRREDPEIARLVSEQIIAALPNIVSQVAAGLNANQANNHGTTANRDCTYKGFRACNPKEFHGTEGAVGLLTWIEGMEFVLHISKCAEGSKVEFAACLLQGRALTWWNTQIQTRGREATNGLTWEEFKKLLKEEYCPKSEIQKLEAELWNHEMKGSDVDSYTARFHELAKLVPHLVSPEENRINRYVWGLAPEIQGNVISANPKTLQDVVNLATKLTNNVIQSGSFASDKVMGKRRMEEPVGKNYSERGSKAQKVIRNFGAQTQTTDKNRGYPKCSKCNYHHSGKCIVCFRYNKGGHFSKDCKIGGNRTCHECGSPNHFRNTCPKLNRGSVTNPAQPVNQENHGGQARGPAFAIGLEEARQDSNVVTGTFLLNNHYASILFDSGAVRSFVSLEFRPKISFKSQKLKEVYAIEFANGREVRARDVIKNCTLSLAKKDVSIDLIPTKVGSFDVVVGMD
ncbi:uncharacterized protein LOC112504408 [Cynara cardunculus var. scolymus]|uniref:uncharacterized protein LOC112504408 n=1 Tax=Cynara cardunculus var. scolymus TaxID=59895 RepID=UPI000D62B6D8|nr:uncharacterized protein LOC112504408 [Cynara cardunculus var. scolymus]